MSRTALAILIFLLAPVGTAGAQAVDLDLLKDDAVRLTQEYLRLRTVNPPGNEELSARFFADIFDREGIEWDSVSSAPGRGNIWARLEGGEEPALLLLHHMDVVSADESQWDVDPFGGIIQDDYIYGRGALDTKTLGILHLQAFIALHRMNAPLRRDVIFMATADEEAGGFYGAGWMLENRPDITDGVGIVLNEFGMGIVEDSRPVFRVAVAEKIPMWLRLTATGKPGHGSTPRVTSAVTRLLRGLSAIQNYDFEPRIIPAVDTYFTAISASAEPPWRERLSNMTETVESRDALLELQIRDPGLHALTRNTCSITMLEGSDKINVVPARASAELDCRLLPDQDPDAFLDLLRTIINDASIEIETIMVFSPAVSSADTELFRTIEDVVGGHYEGATVVPSVSSGFTDSHFFRERNVVSYGFAPFLVPADDMGGVYGNNERISVENVRKGTEMMLDIVRRMAVR
jgi:acetylornithine deacetylase/succinyl-diaminopimelate desuccinylase-like protein